MSPSPRQALPAHLKIASLSTLKSLLSGHAGGKPQYRLDPETVDGIRDQIQFLESQLEERPRDVLKHGRES